MVLQYVRQPPEEKQYFKGETDFNRDAQFPNTTYPDFVSENPIVVAGSNSFQTSPPKYPSPWTEGLGDWAEAYAKAKDFVSQLTLAEKVNLTTGTGWELERCVGQTGSMFATSMASKPH